MLYHLGTVAWSDGGNDLALRCHGEAVALCEQKGLSGLVAVQAFHGDGESRMADAAPRRAIERFERSLALARALGDRGYEAENVMMIGYCHTGAFGIADYRRALSACRRGPGGGRGGRAELARRPAASAEGRHGAADRPSLAGGSARRFAGRSPACLAFQAWPVVGSRCPRSVQPDVLALIACFQRAASRWISAAISAEEAHAQIDVGHRRRTT